MAIDTMDKLIAALCASTVQRKSFHKQSVGGGTTGQFASLWAVAGMPVAGAIPTVASSGGELNTKSTTGAITGLADPAGADVLYLSRFGAECDDPLLTMLYDRLWACSGFSGTVTTAQAVTSPPALTRPDANGNNVELWVEVYSTIGATPRTLTISYTNSSGASGRSATVNIPASLGTNNMMLCTLQAGDTGVQSVQSATLSGSTGTAGNFGLTLLRPITVLPLIVKMTGAALDIFTNGMPAIDTGACLALMIENSINTAGLFTGQLQIIEG